MEEVQKRTKPGLKDLIFKLQHTVTRMLLDEDVPSYDEVQELLKQVNEIINYCETRKRY